jgi:hypothetical protein
MNNDIKVDLLCSVCGQLHNGLIFRELSSQPTSDAPWTHWALCPVKQDRVLLRVHNDRSDVVETNSPMKWPKDAKWQTLTLQEDGK